PVGSSLTLGNLLGSGLVDFQNGLNLAGGTRTIAGRYAELPDWQLSQQIGRVSGVITNGGLRVHGVIELTGANTYASATLLQGTLRAIDGVGLPAASSLQLTTDGSAITTAGVLESLGAATFTRSLGAGAGQISMPTGGFSAGEGPLTVRLNG